MAATLFSLRIRVIARVFWHAVVAVHVAGDEGPA